MLTQLVKQYPYQPKKLKVNIGMLKLPAAAALLFASYMGFTREPDAQEVQTLSQLATIIGVALGCMGSIDIISILNKTHQTNTTAFSQSNNETYAHIQRGFHSYKTPLHLVTDETTLDQVMQNIYHPMVLIPANITSVQRKKLQGRKKGLVRCINAEIGNTIIHAQPTNKVEKQITAQCQYILRPGSNVLEPKVTLNLLGRITGYNNPDPRYGITEYSIELELETILP